MISTPDLNDLLGITAFACLSLLMLLVLVISVMALMSITPAAWFKPVAVALIVGLPVLFAVCVVASEVIR